MAKPIKETPVLNGKDAQRFLSKIKENESKRISVAEYQRAKNNYEELIKNAKI